MLRLRILTAIILIPLTLLLLFYASNAVFLIVTAILTLGGAWEWSNLMQCQTTFGRFIYLLLFASLSIIALFLPAPLILLFASIGWLFGLFLIFIYPRLSAWWGMGIFWRGIMGIGVLIPCWVAINFIRVQNDGVYALLFLFVLIWGADSAAYFVGKKWGKTKLLPQVSPGKSVEGLMGAIVFTIFIVLLGLLISKTPTYLWVWAFVLSLVTILFSVVGDLFESMLKRQANLKDSGKLLPGHGGLLDRIDSLTAAAPIFALGAWILGTLAT